MRYVASCPICLDSSDDDTWVAMDCGHLFHKTCAMQTEYTSACPSCRKKTTIKGTRTVFLSLDELSPSAAHAHGEDRSEELKERLGDLLRASQKQLHEQSQRIELLERKNNELNSENKQLKQLLKEESKANVSLDSALAAINAPAEEAKGPWKGQSEKQKRARNE